MKTKTMLQSLRDYIRTMKYPIKVMRQDGGFVFTSYGEEIWYLAEVVNGQGSIYIVDKVWKDMNSDE